MPKSKGRKHPQQKRKPANVFPVSVLKTATNEPVANTPGQEPSPSFVTSTAAARPYPYLKKELVKVGIVSGICLAVLVIVTRIL